MTLSYYDPFFVVVSGIVAAILFNDLARPDKAYPRLMNLMPERLKGLVFATLVAAIVSSLACSGNHECKRRNCCSLRFSYRPILILLVATKCSFYGRNRIHISKLFNTVGIVSYLDRVN